mmetsp:Transcript_31886/g.46921  ORF Transcript_31886/g.46921 Transcript_31886/m.46921 type:complete len:98 (-) Transcript_31886:210-503(-)
MRKERPWNNVIVKNQHPIQHPPLPPRIMEQQVKQMPNNPKRNATTANPNDVYQIASLDPIVFMPIQSSFLISSTKRRVQKVSFTPSPHRLTPRYPMA